MAQPVPQTVGSWDFTYKVQEFDIEYKGVLVITKEDGDFIGIITFKNVRNTTLTYKLDKVESNNHNLHIYLNKGPLAPMTADLNFLEDRWEGKVTSQIPGKKNKLGLGKMMVVPQTSGTIIDHASAIKNLTDKTLEIGKEYYNQVCAACHGTDGNSPLAAARSFSSDEFKFGSDPYSMWKTITNGAGQMGAQRWLSSGDTYSVIQYIRENLIKDKNPQSYFKITNEYLAGLPKPTFSPEQLQNTIKEEALSGSQVYGQLYFEDHLGDYGPALYTQIKDYPGSSLVINLDNDIYTSYNVQRMSNSVTWKSALDLSKTKYKLYRGDGAPVLNGEVLKGFSGLRWSFKDRYYQLENLVSDRTPYPPKWMNYNGHYQYGDKTILSYSIVGREILEMPSAIDYKDKSIIQNTYTIASGDSWRKLVLDYTEYDKIQTIKNGVFDLNNVGATKSLPEDKWTQPQNSIIVSAFKDNGSQTFFATGVQGDTDGMKWVLDHDQNMALYIPPTKEKRVIRLHRFIGDNVSELEDFAEYLLKEQKKSIPDLTDYTKGGDPLWKKNITIKGTLDVGVPRYDPQNYEKENKTSNENLVEIPENYPYVVDRIPLPFNNPWNSWIRPSGFDFFPDGRLVMSTYMGDIWIANGIDDTLSDVKWQRIATGLYDPFGVKVVKGEVYVTCRDRIVLLKDINGDGETDFYHSFFADSDVSNVPVQAFNYSLQTDSKGNFIYSKGGEFTHDDEPGHIIQVSPDGKKQISLAIGFRTPNGVTLGPKDDIYVSDNQGRWMPANKINLIRKGGFYGYIPSVKRGNTSPGRSEYSLRAPLASANYPEDILPETFDKPIIWLPQEFDNSPGNGAWTPKNWGPLGNRLLHTSFGKGWVYQVMTQEIDGTTQATVSALPFQFSAGTQRARINPVDGQLYVAGITGWDDSFATKYGSLDRIRYTGGEGFFIDAVNVRSNGIELTFNQELDPDSAKQLDNYKIAQWNYRWTDNYGSEDWSVKNPENLGRDTIAVQGIEISKDGKKVLLKLSSEDLKPVDQMRIIFSLNSKKGQRYQDSIYNTIHKVPDDDNIYSGFNYVLFLKIILAGIITVIGWLIYRKKFVR
ncbi:DUF6797 domain-containing protein [Arenibacter echinorum]|uniref:Glucose/arabinose dehydrogenase n=1 Tax=Arenibacter echinorum TaxID=440515 RepID=A0A327R0U1_9FLAO|nr:DUF6797 domain-containing protein [Arenibacter echinorum]RAJ10240.1 glucose/arabinose dehydrogenase [Arenibacter echinorum]